jgi:ribosomal protein S12 methylthiotransferase
MDSVIKRVKELNRQKISELNIIGQDITGYGLDLYGRRALPELLPKIIREAEDIRWIRLLYLYPEKIIEPLLDLIKAEPKLCKYIDLPIQHINDRILKLMQRKTTKADILKIIEKIRKNAPEIAIRTSLIVGFPSETEVEFRELLDFIKEVKFERLGAFIYSREEDTPAFKFAKQIPKKTKLSRLNAVMAAQQDISREVNQKFLGQRLEVLIEEREKDIYLGRSQFDAPEVDGLVYVKSSKKLKPGDFVKIEVTDTLEYDLVGTAIG